MSAVLIHDNHGSALRLCIHETKHHSILYSLFGGVLTTTAEGTGRCYGLSRPLISDINDTLPWLVVARPAHPPGCPDGPNRQVDLAVWGCTTGFFSNPSKLFSTFGSGMQG